MMKLSRISVLFIIFVFSKTFGAAAAITQPDVRKTIPMAEHQLRVAMDQAWTDRGSLLHDYVVESLNNSGQTKALNDQLLKNNKAIADAFGSYYPAASIDKINGLLKDMLTISLNLIDAARKNDAAAINAKTNLWRSKADDFSRYLYALNPNLVFTKTQKLLDDYLQLTIDAINARVKKNWATDVDVQEKLTHQLQTIAEQFSNAIIKQFPAKFK